VVAAESPCDVLVLAAFDPELSPLKAALGPGLSGSVGATAVEARAVGIGLVAAAIGTARLLRVPLPRAVVLIGTCGVYARLDRSPPALGQAVVDVGALSGVVELPAAIPIVCRPDENLRAGFVRQGLPAVEIATTLGVTVSDTLAAEMARGGVEVEHLEAFSVASACQVAGVAFAAVLGVSNAVGSAGREQWRANHRAASAAAAAEVIRWLEGGALGLGPVVD
jgi:nucleoside phosphorylase